MLMAHLSDTIREVADVHQAVLVNSICCESASLIHAELVSGAVV